MIFYSYSYSYLSYLYVDSVFKFHHLVFPAGVRDENVFYTTFYPEILARKKKTLRGQKYPLKAMVDKIDVPDDVFTNVEVVEVFKSTFKTLVDEDNETTKENKCERLIEDLLKSGIWETLSRLAIIADFKNEESSIVKREALVKTRQVVLDKQAEIKKEIEVLDASMETIYRMITHDERELLEDLRRVHHLRMPGVIRKNQDNDEIISAIVGEIKDDRKELERRYEKQIVTFEFNLLAIPGITQDLVNIVHEYI